MGSDAIVLGIALIAWAAVVLGGVLLYMRARALRHSRVRTRNDSDRDLRQRMASALAREPTRVPRGLSRAEVDDCAPEVPVGNLPLGGKGPISRRVEDSEDEYFDEFIEDSDSSGKKLKLSTTIPDCTRLSSDDGSDSDKCHSHGRMKPPGSSRRESAEYVCPVCLDNLQVGERTRTIIKCGHSFHSKCLRVWLRRDDTCPCCRIKLGQSIAVDGIEVIQRAQLALLFSSMETEEVTETPSPSRRTFSFMPLHSRPSDSTTSSSMPSGGGVMGALRRASTFTRLRQGDTPESGNVAREEVIEPQVADTEPPPRAVILRTSFHRGRRRDDDESDLISLSDY